MHLGLFGCFPFLIFVHTKRRKDTFPLEFPFTYLCKLYSNHFHCTLNFNRLCLGMVDGIWVWKSYTIVWVRVFIFLCSRLLAGIESLAKDLTSTVDGQNISFLDAARSAGYAKEHNDLSSVFLKKGSYSAFVELHIEQGPILEEEGLSFFTAYFILMISIYWWLLIHFILQIRYINWYSDCDCSSCKYESRFWRQWRARGCCLDAE